MLGKSQALNLPFLPRPQMAGIAGGVGGAEATVLAHAADIADGTALGVVDLAVKQTDHRGHALCGHE